MIPGSVTEIEYIYDVASNTVIYQRPSIKSSVVEYVYTIPSSESLDLNKGKRVNNLVTLKNGIIIELLFSTGYTGYNLLPEFKDSKTIKVIEVTDTRTKTIISRTVVEE